MSSRPPISGRLEGNSPRRPPRGLEVLTDLPIALAVRGVGTLLARLGSSRGYGFARLLGDAWWALLPGRRQIALRNLEIAFGTGLSPAERERIARASYRHAMATAVDVFVREREIPDAGWRRTIEATPEVEEIIARPHPRGLLLLGAHIGDWEMLPYFLALRGLRVAGIARAIHNPHMDRLATRIRSRNGTPIIGKAGALREVWKILRAGGAAGLLADQSAPPAEGHEEFFGATASTYTSWARLAARAAPEIAFMTCLRDGFSFRFRVRVRGLGAALEGPGGEDERARGLVRAYLAAVEDAVRSAPEQYLWMHRRWKHRRPGEPDLYSISPAPRS